MAFEMEVYILDGEKNELYLETRPIKNNKKGPGA